jgi:alcohol dehydrogenase class IV
MVADVELPTLKDLGIKNPDIERFAEQSEENGSTPDNPRPINKDEYAALFLKAFND